MPTHDDSKKGLLIQAIEQKNVEVLQRLLSEDPHLSDIRCEKGKSALELAVRSGHAGCFQAVLEALSHIKISDALIGICEEALLVAALLGHVEFVSILLEKGASAQCRNYEGCSPLMLAAGRARLSCVELLLPLSDPLARDEHQCCALDWAVQHIGLTDDTACLRALLPHSAPKEKGLGGGTTLMIAALYDRPESILLLLPHSNAVAVDDDHGSALMKAAMNGNSSCIKALIEASDPSQVDKDGCTALMHAATASEHSLACVEWLLPKDEGARSQALQQTNNQGKTPLDLAIHSFNDETADFLASMGGLDAIAHLRRHWPGEEFPRSRAVEELAALHTHLAPVGVALPPQAVPGAKDSGPHVNFNPDANSNSNSNSNVQSSSTASTPPVQSGLAEKKAPQRRL